MRGEPPIHVEQGPEWLANLLYNPPGWLLPVLVLALFVCGVGVVWLAQRAEIDAGAVSEATTNVTVLVVAGVATMHVTPLGWPYIFDVLVGAGIGIVVGYGIAGPAARRAYTAWL